MVVMRPKMMLRVCAFRKRLMSISRPAANISISLPRSPKNCTIGWFTGATSLHARGERPRTCCRAERDELAPFQLIELHSVPSQGRIAGYRISEDQSGGNGDQSRARQDW